MNVNVSPRSPHTPRVVDFSTHFSGPVCSHQLAALGANVLKIEHPGFGGHHAEILRELGINLDSQGQVAPSAGLIITGGILCMHYERLQHAC